MANPANEKVVLNAQYYGDSGGSTTYYYWVQAVYNWGNGGLSNVAPVTVLSLSHSNVVSLNWTPQPTAIYFSVFRNTSNTPPAAGAVTFCIANGYSTADGLVDNGLPTFTMTMLAAGPQAALTPEEAKKQQADLEKAQEEEAKKTPEQKAAEAKAAQQKADAEQKKLDEEAKKEREEADKKTDKILKELEETQKAADEKLAKDQEKARKLNQLYNEKFQLPVRATGAQKELVSKESKDSGSKEQKEPVHTPPAHK